MSQQLKGALYRALKGAGAEFDRPYREYTVAELQAAYDLLREKMGDDAPPLNIAPPQPQAERRAAERPAINLPIKEKDPDEMAGQRLNTNTADLTPIRQDDAGRIWFQEEVLKPAYPKPRGRRVLRRMDGAVETVTVKDGDYTETFEIAGVGPKQATEIKVTLPSFQVGIYKDPRFPFLIVTYNSRQAFRREDIDDYFGGRDLVPGDIKRVYVENVLCYDIRTVIRSIQNAYRQIQLQESRQA
jgi:hypothetical protein